MQPMPNAMPAPQAQVYRQHRWSVADYHKMGAAGILDEDARIELIEGELVEMAPIGSLHAGKLERLRRLLEQAARDTVLVFSQNPIVLGEHSEPRPDIAVLRSREDFYEATHPKPEDVLLLAEVADSSVRYDREVKIPLYARHGILEVWLVDLQEKRLEAHYGLEHSEYRHVDYYRRGQVSMRQWPEVAVDLSDLFQT
jgi:Uma2 family endonuclease